MFGLLLLLFVTIPMVELFLLFKLHEYTQSALATIGLILFTGFVGAWLARQQGLGTVAKIKTAMSEGRIPATELMDGGMILFAAALLLTPGILTDAFGFSLLFPPCRLVYRKLLQRYFPKPNISIRTSNFDSTGFGTNEPFDPDVVDGEARTVADDQKAIDDQT